MSPAIDPTRNQPISDVDATTTLLSDIDAATGRVKYVGRAPTGSLTSASSWRIRNFLYDANNNVIFSGFPNGDPSYTYTWDQRGTYTYA